MIDEEPSLDCTADCAGHDATPERSLPRGRRTSRPWLQGLTSDQFRNQNGNGENDRKKVERIPRRWDRLVRLLGEQGVRIALGSHVTVFGLGGVGGFTVEALARSALGRLTIVDFDDVCVTNVNRQIQAFPGTVGQSKSSLLAERVRAINPDIQMNAFQAFLGPDNSEVLLAPRPDFVVDAIDNVTAKLHLLETCLTRNIPVVSVSGSGARLDPTQIRVVDISETKYDPLAKVIRKELARRGFDTSRHLGLPVVYSEERIVEPEIPSWDAEGFRCICPHAEDSPHACEKRRTIYGTASFVTAAFGMAAASVVVRGLTGAKPPVFPA